MTTTAEQHDAEPAETGENWDAGETGDAEAPQERAVLEFTGSPLDAEELAAVAAVVGRLAEAEPVDDEGAGSTGPSDRTLQRRRHLGLWGRPGPDSWQHAAGLR